MILLLRFVILLINQWPGTPDWAEEPPPEPGEKTPEQHWWRNMEKTLWLLHPRYPFLAGANGRLFLQSILRPIIGNFNLLNELERSRANGGPAPVMLEALYYWYAEEGRRPLEGWAPKTHFANVYEYFNALVQYLFEEHPVPPVVARLWWYYPHAQLPFAPGQEPSRHPVEVLRLYFYLTQGGGLRAAPFLRWELSQGAVAYFYEAPRELSIQQAYWYAIFRAAGLPGQVVLEIKSMPSAYTHTAFWRDLIRLWLKDKEAQAWPEAVGIAIRQLEWLKFGVPHEAYVDNEELASKYAAEPELQLRGRSWASLLRYLEEEIGLREFPLPAGMAPEYSLTDTEGQHYRIVFIGSEQGLIQEGKMMAHCVGNEDYRDQARAGHASFWSLRQEQPNGRHKRLLTVQTAGHELLEAAGLANREVTPAEWEILNDWLATRPALVEVV